MRHEMTERCVQNPKKNCGISVDRSLKSINASFIFFQVVLKFKVYNTAEGEGKKGPYHFFVFRNEVVASVRIVVCTCAGH